MTASGFPHSEILGSKPCWRLPEAYRSLKRPSSVLSAKASTMRPCKQHAPVRTNAYAARISYSLLSDNYHHTKMITKRSTRSIKKSGSVEIVKSNKAKNTKCSSLASTIQFSNHHAPRASAGHHGRASTRGHESHRNPKESGWRSGSPKAHPIHTSRPEGQPGTLMISSTPAARDSRTGTSGPLGRHRPAERWPEFSVERR